MKSCFLIDLSKNVYTMHRFFDTIINALKDIVKINLEEFKKRIQHSQFVNNVNREINDIECVSYSDNS